MFTQTKQAYGPYPASTKWRCCNQPTLNQDDSVERSATTRIPTAQETSIKPGPSKRFSFMHHGKVTGHDHPCERLTHTHTRTQTNPRIPDSAGRLLHPHIENRETSMTIPKPVHPGVLTAYERSRNRGSLKHMGSGKRTKRSASSPTFARKYSETSKCRNPLKVFRATPVRSIRKGNCDPPHGMQSPDSWRDTAQSQRAWPATGLPIRVRESTPGSKMVDPEPCKELRRRISAAIRGWEYPLLTFIYPGFDCRSCERIKPPTLSLTQVP